MRGMITMEGKPKVEISSNSSKEVCLCPWRESLRIYPLILYLFAFQQRRSSRCHDFTTISIQLQVNDLEINSFNNSVN